MMSRSIVIGIRPPGLCISLPASSFLTSTREVLLMLRGRGMCVDSRHILRLENSYAR